jgi:SNF2 family DNA or RNA helicase
MLYFHIKDVDNKLIIEIVKASVNKDQLLHIQSRKLYPEDIQKNFDVDLASFIITEQFKAQRAKGHLVSKNTIEMNLLLFSDTLINQLIDLIKEQNLVFFNRQRLKIEKTKIALLFKCQKLNETLKVQPLLDLKTTLFQLNDATFFNSYIVIAQNKLYFLKEELERCWVKIFKKELNCLEKNEAKDFLADFKNQIIFEEIKRKHTEPILVLNDPSGISARLKFKYDIDVFEINSLIGDHVRNYELEKSLVKDLIDAGYVNKNNQNIFYCPQPKVFEALSLLIEIGWTVFSFQNKKVLLETSHNIEVKKVDSSLQLDAQICFQDDRKINTESILDACLKKQNLFEMSDGVGLIDSAKYQKKLQCFLEEKAPLLTIAKLSYIEALDDNLDKHLYDLKSIFMRKSDYPMVLPNKTFLGDLFNYQKLGLNWLNFLYENRLAAFLADEMGLGKTVQILAFFSLLRNFCPVLIVAPKSLINNWKSEFKRFLPSAMVTDYYGPNRSDSFNLNSFVITTYGTLKEDVEKLAHIKFECIVLDESSFIKNNQTKANQAVSKLNSSFKICLNGTPIENNIDELISQFNFLIPNLINKKLSHQKINSLISPFLLKRTKKSVEIELPEKREQIVYVEMDEMQEIEYNRILSDARKSFSSKDEIKAKKMHVFEALLRLRQICCDPSLIGSNAQSAKLEEVLSDINSVISSHKLIVFSQFTKILQKFKNKLQGHKVLYFDGKTPIKEREKLVNSFQNEEEPCIFLMSLKAAGYGLNLQSADYVFIFDPWWNEAVENQAIDRAHRIGRSRSLIAKKYLTINTIEEKIYRLKLNKLKTSELFTPQNLSTDDLYDLLY